MNSYLTPPAHPLGRWLVALGISLVFWVFAYAHAPAATWHLSQQSDIIEANSSPAAHARGLMDRWPTYRFAQLLAGTYAGSGQPTWPANSYRRASPTSKPTSRAVAAQLRSATETH